MKPYLNRKCRLAALPGLLLLLFLPVSCASGTLPAETGEVSRPIPVLPEETTVPETASAAATSAEGTQAPQTEPVLPPETAEQTQAGTQKQTQPATDAPIPGTETAAETEPPAPAVPLGLYVWMNAADKRTFTRVTDFQSRWPENDGDYVGQWAAGHWTKDTWNFPGETHLICDTKYFFVLPSEAETVTFRNPCWTAAWSREWSALWEQAGLSGARIGYEIETVLKDGRRLYQRVLSPEGTIFEMAPYYEVYLYDEVNRPDGDHVTAALVKDNTVFTDIKITLRNGCYDVDRFVLTAFVYRSDADFDIQGGYCGTVSAKTVVRASNR